jgi:polar amino acid transport system substrate-binding protein
MNFYNFGNEMVSIAPGANVGRIVSLCILLWPLLAGSAELTAYAEESPPYHYMKDGRAVGIATEILQAACLRARIGCNIQIVPWARAYALTTTTPNTLIFSIVRRADREKDFIWLSPIATETMWIYGRQDSPAISAPSQLKARRIGVINGSSAIAELRNAGVRDAIIDVANSTEGNLRKLEARHLDYIVSTDTRVDAAKAKFAMRLNLVKATRLSEVTSYYAISPGSDPKLVAAIKSALAEIGSSAARDKITLKYLPAPAR